MLMIATPSLKFLSVSLIWHATVDYLSTLKMNCLCMSLLYTKIKCKYVLVVAHSAKTTGQPRSTSGHNTCTFTLIIALCLPVSLGRTTKPMARMINVLCGCIWKKHSLTFPLGCPNAQRLLAPPGTHQKQAWSCPPPRNKGIWLHPMHKKVHDPESIGWPHAFPFRGTRNFCVRVLW